MGLISGLIYRIEQSIVSDNKSFIRYNMYTGRLVFPRVVTAYHFGYICVTALAKSIGGSKGGTGGARAPPFVEKNG